MSVFIGVVANQQKGAALAVDEDFVGRSLDEHVVQLIRILRIKIFRLMLKKNADVMSPVLVG